MFETLESRRLLSASASFADGSSISISNGQLTVSTPSTDASIPIIERGVSGDLGDRTFQINNNNTLETVFGNGSTQQDKVNGCRGHNTLYCRSTAASSG